MGFYDYPDRKGICLTEWSEHIEYALPDRYVRVEILKDLPEQTEHRALHITLVEN